MTLNEQKLQRLALLLKTWNKGTVTPEHFIAVIKALVGYIETNEQSSLRGFEVVKSIVQQFKKELNAIELKPGPVGPQGPKGDTGYAPTLESILNFLLSNKKFLERVKGKDGSPDMAEDVRNKLELLQGDERLDLKYIRGTETLLEELRKEFDVKLTRIPPSRGIGGVPGLLTYVDGTKKGFLKGANFKAGTGVTLSHSVVNGLDTITFNSSSSGFTELPATGTPNGVLTAFTFTQKPTYIISDGAWYKENVGWTWSSGTLTATMTIPPNDKIFGFV